jgi:hypothetical protein
VSEIRWKGHWWLPEDPDDAKPGTLHYGDDGRLRLELIGGFSFEVRTPIAGGFTFVAREPSFPVVHGVCGSERFTLLETAAVHTSGGFFGGDVTDQVLSAVRGLRGIHVSSARELIFDSAEVQLEYLLGWARRTTMRAEVMLKDLRWTGEQTARSAPVDALTATYGDMTLTLTVPFHQFRVDEDPRANRRALTSSEWAEVELASPVPVSLDGFNERVKALADLMTLCAHAPSGALKRTLWFTGSEAHPAPGNGRGEVEVMGRQVHHPGPQADAPANVEYLFTLADVDFDVVAPAWLALHAGAPTACNVLFGLKYIGQGYAGTRLLSAASAAEALHQSLHDSAPYSAEDFDQLLDKVLASCAGKDKASKAARKFIRERLTNHMTYRERLVELAAIADPSAVKSLIPDIENWATLLKNARNSVAHAAKSRANPEELAKSAGLQYALTEVTYALLCVVLMAELNLPAGVQHRAASIEPFAIAAGHFADATRSET